MIVATIWGGVLALIFCIVLTLSVISCMKGCIQFKTTDRSQTNMDINTSSLYDSGSMTIPAWVEYMKMKKYFREENTNIPDASV